MYDSNHGMDAVPYLKRYILRPEFHSACRAIGQASRLLRFLADIIAVS